METTHIQSQQNNPKVSEERISSSFSPSPNPNPYSNPQHDSDEINLLEYIYVLVKNKWWIIGAIVLGFVLGHEVAMLKGPTYVSEAVIAPKESDSQKSSPSGLGGFLLSQLNMTGNASLDKINQILDSRKFNADLISTYNLLPAIYKIKWPKVYKANFDTLHKVWLPSFALPKLLGMGSFIKGSYLKKIVNKDNTMLIKVESTDSTFSDTLLSKYLLFLNDYLRNSVQTDARANVKYLGEQLALTPDPLIREKLQELIANELEKDMLVSKDAFKIVDPQFSSARFKEKQLYPMLFATVGFFMVVFIIVILHVFSKANFTSEDRELIKKIRKKLLHLK